LNQKIFKIFSNIVHTRNEEVAEIHKHFFDETSAINFIILNGPAINFDEGQATEEAETIQSKDAGGKSPEQSSKNIEDDESKLEERRRQELKKIQLPCSTKALSAHVKILAEQIVNIQKKDPTIEKQIKPTIDKSQ